MNKIVITVALIVAFVGLVAANKGFKGHRHHHNHHHEGEDEFDLDHGNCFGCGHHQFDEFEQPERHHHLKRGGFGHGFGHEHGHGKGFGKRGRRHFKHGHGHGHGFGHGHGHGFGHGHGHGFGGHKHGHGHGLGFRHGGIRGSEGSFGGIGSHNHLGSSKFAKGHEGSLVAGSNRFDADHHDSDHHDNEGIHKHQVINNDKTIISDRTTGVNDVDGFRNSDGHSDSNHIGLGSSKLAAQEAGGSIGSKLDIDRDVGAIGGQHGDFEAGI